MSHVTRTFIHQPDFLPWIGFFQKLKKSSIYVVLDDVKFIRRGWINRDQIIVNNQLKWITVPVQSKGNYYELIKNIKINYDTNWIEKILKTIKHNYSNYDYFDKHIDAISNIFKKKHQYLIDLNLDLINYILNNYNIKTKIIRSSSLNVKGHKSEKILNILLKLNSNLYITGMGSKNYLNEKIFAKENIKIEYLDSDSTEFKDKSKFYYLNKISIIDFMLKTNKSI